MDVSFNKHDSHIFQKIVDMEKDRASLYSLPSPALLDQDVSKILSNFVLVNKVGNKQDPLSEVVKNKKGIAYMSLETNQVVVHDFKDDDLALATSLELAVILSKDKLVEIKPFLTNQFKPVPALQNNVSSSSKNQP